MSVRPSQMNLAVSLSGHTQAQIAGDLSANLDAGAALLANHHGTGTDLASWQSALVAIQGAYVAQQIYDAIRAGATRTTSIGETITLNPQQLPATIAPVSAAPGAATNTVTTTSPDYPSATWIPADPSNYTVANRAHDYTIDMIVIHDIEGSYGTAIQDFQTPGYAASAHYVVGYQGQIAQMVLEKDIAWHAGNWDYNTRAIGIEHEGFAWTPGLYTTAEYNASAALAASICSRWGVPMDRTHVIGHSEVPDPNNPGLFGGSDHHTDPGPYWDWTYYMATAQADAAALPSPPHVMPDPVAVNGLTSATVTWQAARTCRASAAPITGYTVVGQPGNLTMTLPSTATSATFYGLQQGTTYTFTVTAQNSYGQGSATSNSATPGRCNSVGATFSPASPQPSSTQVLISATSASCPNPLYQFWIQPAGGGAFQMVRDYSTSSSYSWDTTSKATGIYGISVRAKDAASPAQYDDVNDSLTYTLTPAHCTTVSASISPASPAAVGAPVTVTGSATCPNPSPTYEFWLLPPSGTWGIVQGYSPSATFNWSTAGKAPGTYLFSVWARDSTSAASYDAYDSSHTYTLNLARCSAVSLSYAPASPSIADTPVTVTATGSGCPNPRYEFWFLPPGGTWTSVQGYGTSASYSWNTTGIAAGTYLFSAWARDASSTAAYDSYDSSHSYTLTITPCTSVSLSYSPASPGSSGTPVTVTGTASGCPNPRFEFWLLPPGGTWTLVQGYSPTASYSWNTSDRAPGTYLFSVWARDASSTAGYDAYDSSHSYTLTLMTCTSVSVSYSPASPSATGTKVTVTGTAAGCPNARYEFWFLPPSGAWTLIQGYSANATFTWYSGGWAPGSYLFSVWARDAGSSAGYDAYNSSQYYTLN